MWEGLKAVGIPLGGCIVGGIASLVVVALLLGTGEHPGAGFVLIILVGVGAMSGAVVATIWSSRREGRGKRPERDSCT
jgi:predicted membrane protein